MTDLSAAEALIGDDARAAIGMERNRSVATGRRLEFQRWAAAVGDYGKAGYRSVADVVDNDSLQKVRAYKKEMKAAGKKGGA